MHDLIILTRTDRYSNSLRQLRYRAKKLFLKSAMRRTVRKAKKIFTISKYVAGEIVKTFPEANGKVVVTYLGPGNRYSESGELPKGVKEPYILRVGILFKHKNVQRLIEAFEKVVKEWPALSLVLVGDGPERPYLEELIKEKSLPVFITGYVEHENLGALYLHAALFVFPSIDEGFGLPPLEAMVNGIPVVSSNTGPMTEILGDAAIYFDPTDADAIASSILKVIGDEKLQAQLREKGCDQAKKYSWEKMTRETVAVYRETLGEITNF